MLTEIEWWGGLLIIWLVFCYAIIYKEYSDEPKLELGFLSTSVAFFSAGVMLALYFYTLDSQLMQYIYIGFIGFGMLSTVLMFFWPETESMKSKALAKQSDDEEEIGKVYEILGQAIFFFPIIASFGLAFYKASAFFDSFPLFS